MIHPHAPKKLRIGIVGLGYWGPNLARVLNSLEDCVVTVLCDRDPERLQSFAQKYPMAHTSIDAAEIMTTEHVDAIIISTPTKTHFHLAQLALTNGIHTFVEKPLATSTAECDALINLADANNLKLFVGHVFLHSAPVEKLKEMVLNDEFGEIYYMSSTRLNLGPVRHDVSALWDLAPHDISIMLELMESSPVAVNCSGLAYLNPLNHDVCTLNIHFENNRMGIIHVSWLDPHKKREMTIVGSKKMAIYNDIESLEKIKIYDNGVEFEDLSHQDSTTYADFRVSYRYGDIHSPRINEVEPLKAELKDFIDCIIENKQPKTDGHNGRDVVQVLEAAERSLNQKLGDVPLASLLRADTVKEMKLVR
ncbi:MAG: Gfo/Idh/MocA family oxidoreductase [Mariniblastus sp.]|nr:Gfo/Idh/MocA family oxidoreductase [Mariniblastus sp.]